jgi:CBS domain-containing protein
MIAVGLLLLVTDNGLIFSIWLAFIGWSISQEARAAEASAALGSRIEAIRVSDVMDAEPVAVPASATVQQALDDYFLRYGWPWFPVVDADDRLVGVLVREAAEAIPEPARATTPVAVVMAHDGGTQSSMRVGLDEPLEAALTREGLGRLGAILAVDGDGHLRGIVTIDQVRQALKGAPAATG